ncbi:hypothetical protein LPJ59_006261 [Coemansia sp. RSA 2399]|nr:hypothetical protein LPJ59_006261 [Coemansia sp. RSA 2399]KAJ1896430.1 hypothetical protein LPJ81_004745 [Coemansia sp. IMI 209127]
MSRIAVSAYTGMKAAAKHGQRQRLCSVKHACTVSHGRPSVTARRLYSNDRTDDTDANKVTDDKHEALAKNFVNIIRTTEAKTKENDIQKIETVEAAEDQLIESLEKFFSKNKPAVTPELLQMREKLRNKHPKMFEKITDAELDS